MEKTWIYASYNNRRKVIGIFDAVTNDPIREIPLDEGIVRQWLEANNFEDTAIDAFLPMLIAAAVMDKGVNE